MSRAVTLCIALTLAACGVDGAPIKPNGETANTNGVDLTGSATVGVSGGS